MQLLSSSKRLPQRYLRRTDSLYLSAYGRRTDKGWIKRIYGGNERNIQRPMVGRTCIWKNVHREQFCFKYRTNEYSFIEKFAFDKFFVTEKVFYGIGFSLTTFPDKRFVPHNFSLEKVWL